MAKICLALRQSVDDFDAHRYRGYLPGNSRIHLIVGLTVQVILGYHMEGKPETG